MAIKDIGINNAIAVRSISPLTNFRTVPDKKFFILVSTHHAIDLHDVFFTGGGVISVSLIVLKPPNLFYSF